MEEAQFQKRQLGQVIGEYTPLLRPSIHDSETKMSTDGLEPRDSQVTSGDTNDQEPESDNRQQFVPVEALNVAAWEVQQFVPPQCSDQTASDFVEAYGLECAYIHFNRLIALALDSQFQDKVNRVLAVERPYVHGDDDVQAIQRSASGRNLVLAGQPDRRYWSRFNRPLAGSTGTKRRGKLDPTNLVSPLVGGTVTSSGVKSFTRTHARMLSNKPGWGHAEKPFPRPAYDGDYLRCTATFDDTDSLIQGLDALGDGFGIGDGFVQFDNGFAWSDEHAQDKYFLREIVAVVDFRPQWPPQSRDTATTISDSAASSPVSKGRKKSRRGPRLPPRTPPLAVRRRPATFGMLREDATVRQIWDAYLETQAIAPGFARGTWRGHVLRALSWIDGLPADMPVRMDAEVRCTLREYRDVGNEMKIAKQVVEATTSATPAAIERYFRPYGAQNAVKDSFEADGSTELMRACRDGDIDGVKLLLRNATAANGNVEVGDLIDGVR